MKIDIEERGSVTILRPEDRLDIIGYLEFEERLGELVAAGRSRLVLDLEETSFINSTAMSVMGRFWADCARAGGVLVIARPSKESRHFLRLAKLDELVDCFESIDDAVEAAARRGATGGADPAGGG